MIEFSVAGPFKVPLTRAATGAVDLDLKKCFAQLSAQHDGFQEKGCYVFSLSVPYGYQPAYVGKTVNATIIKEAFNPSNQLKITRHLNDIRRVDGTPRSSSRAVPVGPATPRRSVNSRNGSLPTPHQKIQTF